LQCARTPGGATLLLPRYSRSESTRLDGSRMFITPQILPVSLARLAATAHVVYSPEVRHPVEVTANEEEHLVGWLSKRLGTTLKAQSLRRLAMSSWAGGCSRDRRAGRALHVPGRARPAPDAVRSRQRGEPRDTAFRFSQEDRVSVFYWVDGNFGYALSGEIRREQLLQVAEVVYKQLNP